MMMITRTRIIKQCCTCLAVLTISLGLLHLLVLISWGSYPVKNGSEEVTTLSPTLHTCLPLCDLTSQQFFIRSPAVLKSPSDLCSHFSSSSIDLLLLVHSATGHFAQRSAIRHFSKASSLVSSQRWRTVFVLGTTANSSAEKAIEREHHTFGDLLQGGFLDSYRNLTVKHLFGLAWTVQVQKCPIRAVLKVDDDIFVNYYRLAALLKKTHFFADSQTPKLLCYLHQDMPVNHNRSSGSKWTVSREEFPGDHYPPFCSGWAYLTTPKTISHWLCALPSVAQPHFWIDDVFVTGVLRERAHKGCQSSPNDQVLPINHLYSVDPGQVASWLQGEEKEEGFKYPRKASHTLKRSPHWFYLFSNTDRLEMLRAALQHNFDLHSQPKLAIKKTLQTL